MQMLRLRWNATETDGGSRVLAYVVERCEAGSVTGTGAVKNALWERVGSSTQCEILVRLTRARTAAAQQYRVRAKNALGAGEPCE